MREIIQMLMIVIIMICSVAIGYLGHQDIESLLSKVNNMNPNSPLITPAIILANPTMLIKSYFIQQFILNTLRSSPHSTELTTQ